MFVSTEERMVLLRVELVKLYLTVQAETGIVKNVAECATAVLTRKKLLTRTSNELRNLTSRKATGPKFLRLVF